MAFSIFATKVIGHMRFVVLFIVFLLPFGTTTTYGQDLDTYQGKNRIILLKDANLESDWLRAQLKRLKSEAQYLLEREVLLFLVNDKGVYDGMFTKTEFQADSIITKYGLSNFEGLVLIGKDGGTKLKEEFIVNPTTIIELIDTMPLRSKEMEATKVID